MDDHRGQLIKAQRAAPEQDRQGWQATTSPTPRCPRIFSTHKQSLDWLLRHWFTTEVDHESGGVWPLLDLHAGSAGARNGRDHRSDSRTQYTSAPLGMNLPERPREGRMLTSIAGKSVVVTGASKGSARASRGSSPGTARRSRSSRGTPPSRKPRRGNSAAMRAPP
jgi:hypothetical protein